jgi:hypothetical protein
MSKIPTLPIIPATKKARLEPRKKKKKIRAVFCFLEGLCPHEVANITRRDKLMGAARCTRGHLVLVRFASTACALLT